MKHNRTILIIITLLSMATTLLAACATDTGPVTLTVNGLVNKELQFTDQALRKLPVVTLTLEHPKNGPTEYTGVRLNDVLNEAGIKDGAATITLTASDGFSNEIDLATIQDCVDCLVSFDPETAGMYNAAMPDQSSKAWVKQLISISVK
jgi:hypothetical protein